MAPSLADRILRHTQPGARRGFGSVRHPAAAPAPRQPPSPEDLARIRTLFAEVTREWAGLEAAVEEFRKALEPDDFEEALSAVGLSPLVTSLPAEVFAGVLPAAAPAAAPAPGKPAATPAGATRRRRAPAAGHVSGPAGGVPAEPPATDGAVIQGKLSELLALLKENLAARESSSTQKVEIPRDVRMEIAREVAGRIKETVLSSLQPGAAAPAAPEAARPPAPAPAAEKRIPIDDVAAIIDQITRSG